MRAKIISIMAILLLLIGCAEDDWREGTQTVVLKSYIGGFVECVKATGWADRGFYDDGTGRIFGYNYMTDAEWGRESFRIEDGVFLYLGIGGGNTINGAEDNPYKGLYFETIETIGDTNYNKEVETIVGIPVHGQTAIFGTMDYFKITADKDYDDLHPAGTDLGEYFAVFYNDLYGFVKNGYDYSPGAYEYEFFGSNVPDNYISGRLSDVDFSQKPYIGNTFYCHLLQAPAQSGKYKFTIDVSFVDGDDFSLTLDPIKISAQ